MLRKIKDKEYVALQGTPTAPASPPLVPVASSETGEEYDISEAPEPPAPATVEPALSRRVYITHGKSRAFIDPLKELLAFGELEPVVSVERETVSQPVPDKVIGDMRTCSAAIIHVDEDRRMLDNEGHPHPVLNENVLVEIGAALALYGKRFILLVKSGVELPSNLQGLYQVRYDGDKLDGEATIRLLKAINDIKNHPLP
jgi:predicted nucleotide-binding protein